MAAVLLWTSMLAITSGTPAQTCQFPSVVTFRSGDTKCTATVIHPEVILTAAHCLPQDLATKMRFGEHFSPHEYSIEPAFCRGFPGFAQTGSPADDFGFCRLAEPAQVPVTPLAAGCEVEALAPGTAATIVGFGLSAPDAHFGDKHYALTEIASAPYPDGSIFVGDAVTGGCLGDSGGPALVQTADGSWRTVGVLAFGPACGEGPSLYASVHAHLDWLERESGIDVTSCPQCAGFAADPLAPTGPWRTCEGPLSGAEMACPEPEPQPEPDDAGTDQDNGPGHGCRVGPTPCGWWLAVLASSLAVWRRRERCQRRSWQGAAPKAYRAYFEPTVGPGLQRSQGRRGRRYSEVGNRQTRG